MNESYYKHLYFFLISIIVYDISIIAFISIQKASKSTTLTISTCDLTTNIIRLATAIRSGDYYMFEEFDDDLLDLGLEPPRATLEEVDDDSDPGGKVTMSKVSSRNTLINIISYGEHLHFDEIYFLWGVSEFNMCQRLFQTFKLMKS
jgi:hypothetical protein